MCNNTKCSVGVLQSLDNFCTNRKFSDGLNPRCKACNQAYKKAHYQKNKENILKKTSEWQKNNPDKVSKRNKKWRDSNPEKMKTLVKNWKVNNKKRDMLNRHVWSAKNIDRIRELRNKWYHNNKETQIAWRTQNIGKMRSYYAKRRALLINATLPWVNLNEIQKIYENCPFGYQVDHIIPLNNKLVCGLHVPWNLQYLTVKENLKKGNRIKEISNECIVEG